MRSYLVETYLRRGSARERHAGEERARSATEDLGVRHVVFERSIYLPEDEICFFLFRAPSARDAALAAERAGLDPVRVVEAISSTTSASSRTTRGTCRPK